VTHLTVAVLLAAYSASLVSYLAFRLPILPFHTFSELLNDSTYQLGLHAGSHMGKFDMVRVRIQFIN
jgi:ABC-type branched-subunit amino acid transport system permease subunit